MDDEDIIRVLNLGHGLLLLAVVSPREVVDRPHGSLPTSWQ